jgi:myosin heavy subunit
VNLKPIGTVLVVGSLAAAAWFYLSNQQASTELARLRTENQALRDAQTAVEEQQASKGTAETNELAQLRRENADLLRLRNEVQQLRQEKQQLGLQVQTAQVQAQQAQDRAQNVQAQAQAQMQAQLQALQNAAQAATSQPTVTAAGVPGGVFTKEQLQMQQRYGITMDAATATAACINNLRQLDGAKQQWALENNKTATAMPQMSDLAPYLRNASLVCPSGGAYTLNTVGAAPTCSQPGHTLGN